MRGNEGIIPSSLRFSFFFWFFFFFFLLFGGMEKAAILTGFLGQFRCSCCSLGFNSNFSTIVSLPFDPEMPSTFRMMRESLIYSYFLSSWNLQMEEHPCPSTIPFPKSEYLAFRPSTYLQYAGKMFTQLCNETMNLERKTPWMKRKEVWFEESLRESRM